MSRSLGLIPLSALAAIALAACGSSNSSTVPSLGGGTQAQAGASPGSLAAWRAAVACARKHGMPDVPDPAVGPDGQITIPGGTPTPTPEVRSACAKQIDAVQPTGSTHPIESASDIRALLRVAACMRSHGIPRWPDPNDRGEFQVGSVPFTEAQYNRATRACDSLIPPSGWHVIATPGGQ